MSDITGSVGKGGANLTDDVKAIQRLLNDNMSNPDSAPLLDVDGIMGPKTQAAIEAFQKDVVGMGRPDSRVDPDGPTFKELVKIGCPQPDENYPYSENTFTVIGQLAETIRSFSKQYDVPPIAVAGSIADEFNTMHGVRGVLDWLQDHVLIGLMPSFAIKFDAWAGFNTKFLNATKHDLGKGNIKLETAKRMYDQFKNTFDKQNMDYSDLVNYLLSDRGTVHVAALVIQKAKQEAGKYVDGSSEEKAEGVFVTYYKQGPNYLQRFQKARAKDPNHRLQPGEGCRVILQRQRFKDVLGID